MKFTLGIDEPCNINSSRHIKASYRVKLAVKS